MPLQVPRTGRRHLEPRRHCHATPHSVSDRFEPPAAEPPHMHETRATATFAISLQHSTWKCFVLLVLYSYVRQTRATPTYLTRLARGHLPCSHCLPCLHALPPAALFPSAAAEWAKPSGSAAALVARQACGTILNRRCIEPPYPPLARHLDLRILKHCVFLWFYNYPALNTHISRIRACDFRTCPSRRGALNMYET